MKSLFYSVFILVHGLTCISAADHVMETLGLVSGLVKWNHDWYEGDDDDAAGIVVIVITHPKSDAANLKLKVVQKHKFEKLEAVSRVYKEEMNLTPWFTLIWWNEITLSKIVLVVGRSPFASCNIKHNYTSGLLKKVNIRLLYVH